MKALKIFLFIIVLLVLLVVVLGLLGPKTYDVSRNLDIDAPIGMVYNEVASLSAQEEWGPWKEQEPDMVTTIHGTDKEVGSYSHWVSSQSEGEQKIVNLVENELVETELKFIKPMESEANGYFKVAETATGSTNLTWGFKGENGFMSRAMSMIGMDMESFVAPMFEKGLQNVKGVAETKAKEQAESMKKMGESAFAIGLQDMGAMSYILKREVVPMADIATFYATNLPAIFTAVGASGNEPAGAPSGLFYSWDMENNQTDMCAAIPVSNKDLNIEGYQTVTIPAGRVAKIAYRGSYEGSEAAHYAMADYLKANGLEQNGPVIEEYVTDPSTEPDTTKWLTNILYHVN